MVYGCENFQYRLTLTHTHLTEIKRPHETQWVFMQKGLTINSFDSVAEL